MWYKNIGLRIWEAFFPQDFVKIPMEHKNPLQKQNLYRCSSACHSTNLVRVWCFNHNGNHKKTKISDMESMEKRGRTFFLTLGLWWLLVLVVSNWALTVMSSDSSTVWRYPQLHGRPGNNAVAKITNMPNENWCKRKENIFLTWAHGGC